MQVASQGDVRSLRELLDWLDRTATTVAELRVHTPDLDDVFFALTVQEPTR
jgi:ABC-2 type transport system ATP-binding protein